MSMPSKADIFEYWKDWLDKNCMDWGEPCCWACGRYWEDKYDIKNPKATWEEIKDNWSNVLLQRCHIIPRSLGGSNDVSNLFLMCKECHDLAPNTTSQEAFLKWVKKQNWIDRINFKIKEALDSLGFKENDYEELNKILTSQEFRNWFKQNVGLHFNQEGYGVKLTPATIVSALWEYRNIMKK